MSFEKIKRDALRKAKLLEKREQQIESIQQLKEEDAQFRKEATTLKRILLGKGTVPRKKVRKKKKH